MTFEYKSALAGGTIGLLINLVLTSSFFAIFTQISPGFQGFSSSYLMDTGFLFLYIFSLVLFIAIGALAKFTFQQERTWVKGAFAGLLIYIVPIFILFLYEFSRGGEFVGLGTLVWSILYSPVIIFWGIIGWLAGKAPSEKRKKYWVIGTIVYLLIVLLFIFIFAIPEYERESANQVGSNVYNENIDLYNQATTSLDSSYCNKIIGDNLLTERCKNEISALKNNDVSYCDNFPTDNRGLARYERLECYKGFASIKNDTSVCKRLTDSIDNVNECIDAVCNPSNPGSHSTSSQVVTCEINAQK